MFAVTLSSKFQIVIPKEIRGKLGLIPGEKIFIVPYQNRIELVIEKNILEMRRILEGMDTAIKREKKERV